MADRIGTVDEFRRAHVRRTHVGDVLRRETDSHGRVFDRVVEAVEGAPEFIARTIDGRFYRFRYSGEKTALVMPARQKRGPVFVE